MNSEKCPCLSLLNSYAERTIDLTETYGIVAKCEEGEKAEICMDYERRILNEPTD